MIPFQSGRGKELNIKSWIVSVKESQARPEFIYMLLYLLFGGGGGGNLKKTKTIHYFTTLFK